MKMVGANAACFPARRTVPPKADLTNEEAMLIVGWVRQAIEEIES